VSETRRIAINTGGGDAPGLNAVIRAATLAATRLGWEVTGIRDSFDGLLAPSRFAEGGVCDLTPDAVRGITHLGGTILGTTNKGNPFAYPVRGPDGVVTEVDRGDELVAAFEALGLEALVAIGGDGSLEIAHELCRRGIPVVGVPKTIDNDLDGTVLTFGFDTAVSFAVDCIDRLHSTAQAHERVFVIEVMGRYAGWIALHAGMAATADAILLPEIPYDLASVATKIQEREATGRRFSIIVVAEGALPVGGERTVRDKEVGRLERLGGVGEIVAEELQVMTGKETRSVSLGHLLRGGPPTAFDRLIALRFGTAAVRAIREERFDVMVSLDPPDVRYVALRDAVRRAKLVPLDGDTIATARALGMSLGD